MVSSGEQWVVSRRVEQCVRSSGERERCGEWQSQSVGCREGEVREQ